MTIDFERRSEVLQGEDIVHVLIPKHSLSNTLTPHTIPTYRYKATTSGNAVEAWEKITQP